MINSGVKEAGDEKPETTKEQARQQRRQEDHQACERARVEDKYWKNM